MSDPVGAEPDLIKHWIDGKPYDGSTGRKGDVYDPSTGRLTRQVAFASAADVDHAVDAAAESFASWRTSSLAQRTKILFAFRELFSERAAELASIVTREHGKVLSDSSGEVARALEVIEFACGIPQLLKGGYSAEASTQIDVYSMRQPLGVTAIISPFEFPGDGPGLVLSHRDRLREHSRVEAERKGSVSVGVDG